jgi:dienelactone hydrolase
MQPNLLGVYGPWAAELLADSPAPFSFRHERWTDVETWRAAARARLMERLAPPAIEYRPQVTVHGQFTYDGLAMEELSWQLPYGPPTQAVFMKPEGATGSLPGVLALHDHGGNKYFGKDKIANRGERRHPVIVDHQAGAYGGVAWANQLAKRGYAVLVHDAYAFASRRVRLQDVPPAIRSGLPLEDDASVEYIQAYNRWAAEHEHVMAKSLFCAGTTWPGVFLSEDRWGLDALCARPDVDAGRVGVAGLSGGGLRTVFLAGSDPRVRCAVCVGMMTTWRDCLLHKSYTHTWMCYVPLLPNDLDYPEILGLRVPQATLVQNNIEDALFTMPEMKRADQILQAVYDKAGAGDRYRCTFYPGPHKFELDMQAEAFDWLDTWLG